MSAERPSGWTKGAPTAVPGCVVGALAFPPHLLRRRFDEDAEASRDWIRYRSAIRSHHPDELPVYELAYAEIGKLAAVTRVFDAAKGQFGRGPARLVDEHHAGIDMPGDTFAAFDVVGNNRSAQPVRRVVSEPDSLIVVLDAEDRSSVASSSKIT